MSNLARFIAAVAHITDFPIERSDYYGNYNYFCDGATLIGTEEGHLITVSVIARNGDVYRVRVYGGVSLYHSVLKRRITLDTRTNKYVTYSNSVPGTAFSNLYDAMKHCGGTHGWI